MGGWLAAGLRATAARARLRHIGWKWPKSLSAASYPRAHGLLRDLEHELFLAEWNGDAAAFRQGVKVLEGCLGTDATWEPWRPWLEDIEVWQLEVSDGCAAAFGKHARMHPNISGELDALRLRLCSLEDPQFFYDRSVHDMAIGIADDLISEGTNEADRGAAWDTLGDYLNYMWMNRSPKSAEHEKAAIDKLRTIPGCHLRPLSDPLIWIQYLYTKAFEAYRDLGLQYSNRRVGRDLEVLAHAAGLKASIAYEAGGRRYFMLPPELREPSSTAPRLLRHWQAHSRAVSAWSQGDTKATLELLQAWPSGHHTWGSHWWHLNHRHDHLRRQVERTLSQP